MNQNALPNPNSSLNPNRVYLLSDASPQCLDLVLRPLLQLHLQRQSIPRLHR